MKTIQIPLGRAGLSGFCDTIRVHWENLILYLIGRAVMARTYDLFSQIKAIKGEPLSQLVNHLLLWKEIC